MTLFYGWNVEPATIIFLAWMLSFTSEFSASLIINWLSLLFETWGRRRRLSLLLQTRNRELKGVCPREALQGHVQCCNLSPYLPMVYTFIPYSSTDLESYLQYTNQNMLLSCFQNFHCATISYRIKTEFHLCKAVCLIYHSSIVPSDIFQMSPSVYPSNQSPGFPQIEPALLPLKVFAHIPPTAHSVFTHLLHPSKWNWMIPSNDIPLLLQSVAWPSLPLYIHFLVHILTITHAVYFPLCVMSSSSTEIRWILHDSRVWPLGFDF